MAGEVDQTLRTISESVADDTNTASRTESNVPVTSSSSNAATEKMVNRDTPMQSDYWKKSTVTEADHSAYHTAD
jgi:hypothetical protein